MAIVEARRDFPRKSETHEWSVGRPIGRTGAGSQESLSTEALRAETVNCSVCIIGRPFSGPADGRVLFRPHNEFQFPATRTKVANPSFHIASCMHLFSVSQLISCYLAILETLSIS